MSRTGLVVGDSCLLSVSHLNLYRKQFRADMASEVEKLDSALEWMDRHSALPPGETVSTEAAKTSLRKATLNKCYTAFVDPNSMTDIAEGTMTITR